jgi:hypothetical protein
MKACHSPWVNSKVGPDGSLEARNSIVRFARRHSTQLPFKLKLLFVHICGVSGSLMIPPGSENAT